MVDGSWVLAAIVAAGTVVSLAWRPEAAAQRRWAAHPGVWLLAVTLVIYLNQVLFTVYVVRVHHGSALFVARYLPTGWFALDRGPAMLWLANHFPLPATLLAPTVLRVQAFCELPFVVFAYLTVCRWFSPALLRRAASRVWVVSIAWTATFCLVEWMLQNPYTVQDIIVRCVAAALVPIWVMRHGVGDAPASEPAATMPGFLVFTVSAGALGLLVLVVYDTALLYNLGHLRDQLPRAALAAGLLVAARFSARRLAGGPAGPGVGFLAGTFGRFLVLFFVPALPIRYGLGFGTPVLSAVAVLLLGSAAAVGGWQDSAGQLRTARRVAALLVPLVVAAACAYVGWLASGGYPETRLLVATAARTRGHRRCWRG